MSKKTLTYEITDIDFWEHDALLVINGHKLYFQWNKEPSLEEALRFIGNKSFTLAILGEP